jgi:hypothetical protein
VPSRSGSVPPSARRLALPVDSEDYAFEFLLEMPVSGIRTHAQVYAKILVTLGFGSLLTLEGLQDEEFLTKQTADAGVQIPQGYAKTIVQQAKLLHSVQLPQFVGGGGTGTVSTNSQQVRRAWTAFGAKLETPVGWSSASLDLLQAWGDALYVYSTSTLKPWTMIREMQRFLKPILLILS